MSERPSLKPQRQFSKSESGAVGGALTTVILAYGQRQGWNVTAAEAGAVVTLASYGMAYVQPVIAYYAAKLRAKVMP